MKKLHSPQIKDLSEEDLLEKMEDEEDGLFEASAALDNDVYLFIREYDVGPGEKMVTFSVLNELYRKWSKAPESRIIVKDVLSNFITIKGNACMINQSLYDLLVKLKPLFKSRIVANGPTVASQHARIREYLKYFAITAGEDLILNTDELYYFYDKWVYNNTKKGTDYNTFCKYLNGKLKHKEVGPNLYYYKLSKSIYAHINKEEITAAKEWAKKRQNTKR